jgi:hypothetical protein
MDMSEPMNAPGLSQNPAAVCARRYRARRKDGIFVARIRISPAVVKFLVDSGFLAENDLRRHEDIERAIYALLNTANRLRVRYDGVPLR